MAVSATDLECAVCLSVLYDPVSLPPCGHSFCRSCLSEALLHARRCPSCRRPCDTCAELRPANSLLRQLVLKFFPDACAERASAIQAGLEGNRRYPLFCMNGPVFPGQALGLHLFEPRYRVMMSRMQWSEPETWELGYVTSYTPADGTVGVLCKLDRIDALPSGTYGIAGRVTTQRFRCKDVVKADQTNGLYFTKAEFFSDVDEDDAQIALAAVKLWVSSGRASAAVNSGYDLALDWEAWTAAAAAAASSSGGAGALEAPPTPSDVRSDAVRLLDAYAVTAIAWDVVAALQGPSGAEAAAWLLSSIPTFTPARLKSGALIWKRFLAFRTLVNGVAAHLREPQLTAALAAEGLALPPLPPPVLNGLPPPSRRPALAAGFLRATAPAAYNKSISAVAAGLSSASSSEGTPVRSTKPVLLPDADAGLPSRAAFWLLSVIPVPLPLADLFLAMNVLSTRLQQLVLLMSRRDEVEAVLRVAAAAAAAGAGSLPPAAPLPTPAEVTASLLSAEAIDPALLRGLQAVDRGIEASRGGGGTGSPFLVSDSGGGEGRPSPGAPSVAPLGSASLAPADAASSMAGHIILESGSGLLFPAAASVDGAPRQPPLLPLPVAAAQPPSSPLLAPEPDDDAMSGETPSTRFSSDVDAADE